MASQRTIRCDCGNLLKEQNAKIDDVKTPALVCPQCGFTTLTKDQAKNFVKLKQLHSIIDAERKIGWIYYPKEESELGKRKHLFWNPK